MLALFFFTKL